MRNYYYYFRSDSPGSSSSGSDWYPSSPLPKTVTHYNIEVMKEDPDRLMGPRVNLRRTNYKHSSTSSEE